MIQNKNEKYFNKYNSTGKNVCNLKPSTNTILVNCSQFLRIVQEHCNIKMFMHETDVKMFSILIKSIMTFGHNGKTC